MKFLPSSKEVLHVNITHVIAGAIGALVASLGKTAWSYVSDDPYGWLWLITLIAPLVSSLLAYMYLAKKIGGNHKELLHQVTGRSGPSAQRTLYFYRDQQFAQEKQELAKIFATQLLPELLKKHGKGVAPVYLMLDSGTTIAPVLGQIAENLPTWDKEAQNIWKERVAIWTNNGAGISQLHCYSYMEGHEEFEEKVNLFPGNPLSTYRAITGKRTTAYLNDTLAREEPKPVFISVLTANWILGGPGLTSLALCARGRGHREFKEACITCSKDVVIISPLGKLLTLRVEDINDLNKVLKESGDPSERVEYHDPIQISNPETVLLTTLRSSKLSPLKIASDHLERHQKTSSGAQYKLSPHSHNLDPMIGIKSEAEWLALDIPEECMRNRVKDLYH